MSWRAVCLAKLISSKKKKRMNPNSAQKNHNTRVLVLTPPPLPDVDELEALPLPVMTTMFCSTTDTHTHTHLDATYASSSSFTEGKERARRVWRSRLDPLTFYYYFYVALCCYLFEICCRTNSDKSRFLPFPSVVGGQRPCVCAANPGVPGAAPRGWASLAFADRTGNVSCAAANNMSLHLNVARGLMCVDAGKQHS